MYSEVLLRFTLPLAVAILVGIIITIVIRDYRSKGGVLEGGDEV